MLIRLLRVYLRPYRRAIYLLLVLQAIQALLNLYLPNLNAEIIDNGVLTGNTRYIWKIGGWMLVVAMVQAAFASGPSTSVRASRCPSAATSA